MIGPRIRERTGFNKKLRSVNVKAIIIRPTTGVFKTNPGTHRFASHNAKAFPAVMNASLRSQCMVVSIP
jgi:hypothetical protein